PRSYSASTSWAASSAAAPPPRSTTPATSPLGHGVAIKPSAGSGTPTSSASTSCLPPAPKCTSSSSSPRTASSFPVSRTAAAFRRTSAAESSASSSPPSPTAFPKPSSTGTLSRRTNSSTTPVTSRSPTSGSPPLAAPLPRAMTVTTSSKPNAVHQRTWRRKSYRGRRREGTTGGKAEIWSCGVILFVLNAGYRPFNDPNLTSPYRKIYRDHHRCPRWTSLAPSPAFSTPIAPPASPSMASAMPPGSLEVSTRTVMGIKRDVTPAHVDDVIAPG
ncbi:CBL-interacting serine threonine-protein kinase 11, partial [Musa troglodytarum]